MAAVQCGDPQRLADVRASGLNGIDSIDVSDDQLTLSVLLFGQVPDGLTAANFRLDGGAPVTVTALQPCPQRDPDLQGCLLLSVDQPGDFSCYKLSVVTAGPDGLPGTAPYPGFDVCSYYACFTFKQNCPALADCAAPAAPAAAPPAGPVIDYLARDFASLRQALLDRLSLTLPNWTETHLPDTGIALVEVLAYAGDLLNYRLDADGTEAYLGTARLRTSVRRHARLVDYLMHDGCAARAYICLTVSAAATLPAGDFRFAADTETFEPLTAEDVPLYPEHNEISLWTWGDSQCCLPAGATTATLKDTGLQLNPGDLLLFQEIVGAVTGLPADADPTHQQVVRLTATTPGRDPLYDQPVLEVSWDRADALTFPLCVTARGGPDCTVLTVGVARANVVLAEHGASNDWDGGGGDQVTLPAAPAAPGQGCPPGCGWGCPDDDPADTPPYPPFRYRPAPTAADSPVTQHVAFPDPRRVAAGQAAVLAGLPASARARIGAMLSEPALSAADQAYLTMLFGAAVLARYPLSTQLAMALRLLLGRFETLLAVKLSRLDYLINRAREGYLLTVANEGAELDAAWGAGTGQLIDRGRPVFRGPAAAALRPDPRAALPQLTATDPAAGSSWRPRRDLLHCGPADAFFVGETDDNAVLTLRFGDGTAGLQPPPGATLQLCYRVGNGTAGNVGADTITTLELRDTSEPAVTAVRNPLAAAGGTDPEPVALVRQRAPRAFAQALQRAVTAGDYAQLAGEHSGVQAAGAQLRWTGSWYEAQVAIDPLGTETAPCWLLADELRLLERYRRIGHDVRVATAVRVPVELALCVQVQSGYITDDVRSAVLAQLGSGVAPDGTPGMFNLTNLAFGTPVRVSVIVAAVAELPGVAAAAVTRLKRQFGPDEGAVTAGVLTFAPDEVPQLDNDPSHPDHGLITLTIGGGR